VQCIDVAPKATARVAHPGAEREPARGAQHGDGARDRGGRGDVGLAGDLGVAREGGAGALDLPMAGTAVVRQCLGGCPHAWFLPYLIRETAGNLAVHPVQQGEGIHGPLQTQSVEPALNRLLTDRINGLPKEGEVIPFLTSTIEGVNDRIVVHQEVEGVFFVVLNDHAARNA